LLNGSELRSTSEDKTSIIMPGENKTNKIRVCFVAPKAYPIFNPAIGTYFGGAEVDLYYLATEIAKDADYEVSFIVADYGQKDIEVIEDVVVIKSLNFRANALSGLFKTWIALKTAGADIYVLKCASPGVPVVAKFCKLHQKSFVYRLASLLESDGTYVRQHPVLGRLFRWSLRQAKLVFAQNKIDNENLTRTMGISSQVIPNGHRLPAAQKQKRDTILWVGRDDPVKKPERFLELARAIPNEHFTIICQTLNDDQHYKDLIEQAGQIANLEFIRHVPFNRINDYFQRAKVLVNTSDSEGFPNTFIQACNCGAAILSFNVNPDGFLETYKCGLCSNGDFARMTQNMRFLLDGDRYVEFGAEARRYSEKYHDIKKIAGEYKVIFQNLLKAQNGL
jgi:glycosyltransferase involved in cell wall biosynthesis